MNDKESSFNIGETTKIHDDFQVNKIVNLVDEVVASIGELATQILNHWQKS